MYSKKYHQVKSILLLFAAVYFSFYSLMPSFKNETTSNTQFSNQNALKHLEIISQKPHFTGSPEHTVVLNYLVNEFKKLGLEVEIQEQVAINSKSRAATKTKNIVAKIKGTEKGKALLLLSHYDSNPHSSLGASDAGSGVVVILEGIRAFLANNKPPKNDIIICITDAEELGLLGANAFVNHHPLAKDVGLVLNFEARGSGGPSYMLLETNGGNKNLIEAFQKTNTSNPVASSLMYSIYKMLPNDTDLTVFREDGNIDGFNFAFIDDHFDYHTVQDSFERMDLNTFQHQVSYLTATVDYFANSNLENLKSEVDYVFFNFPYFGLVFYPFSWIFPMLIICAILFLTFIFIGFGKGKLTVKGILKGFIPFIISLIFSGLLGFYGWKLLLKIHPQYNDILHGFTYNGYLYIAVFVSFAGAFCFWIYKRFLKKSTAQDLLIAPLLFWLIINGGVAFYLKGAAYFMLPVVVLLIMLSVLIFSEKRKKASLFFTLLAIPVLIIFTPLIQMFPVGLGLKMLIISTVFTVLLFGFLIPVFHQYQSIKNFGKVFFLIGCLTLISAEMQSDYSSDRKQPNSIFYVLDANKDEAYWASYNLKTDAFTQQFLGENPTSGSFDSATTASKYKTKIKLRINTQVKSIQKPVIKIERDTIIESERHITLKIISKRNANKLELLTNIPIKFKTFMVNGEALKNKTNSAFVLSVNQGTVMSYFRTSEDEVVEINFTVENNQQFNLDVMEIKYDLFENNEFDIQPRSENMMPMPFLLNDATVIKTNLIF